MPARRAFYFNLVLFLTLLTSSFESQFRLGGLLTSTSDKTKTTLELNLNLRKMARWIVAALVATMTGIVIAKPFPGCSGGTLVGCPGTQNCSQHWITQNVSLRRLCHANDPIMSRFVTTLSVHLRGRACPLQYLLRDSLACVSGCV